jgi:hypothetical protein
VYSAHAHPLAGLFPWDPGGEQVLLPYADERPPAIEDGPLHLFF